MFENIIKRVVDLGLKFRFKKGGDIFDLSNMSHEEIIDILESLFADDAVLMTDNPEDMQKIIDIFTEVSAAYGQEISLTKSVILIASKTSSESTSFYVNGNKLSNV